MNRYRQTGEKLGAYIRANDPSTQQIQALLGDLLAEDELLLPMKDAVARPAFNGLKPHAGSGTGATKCYGLLQELGRSYLPAIVERIGSVLAGMLDLVAVEADAGSNSAISDHTKSDPWEDNSPAHQIPWDTNGDITVQNLATHLEVEAERILRFLLRRGMLTTSSQTIDTATAVRVMEELDCPRAEKEQKAREENLAKSMGDLMSKPTGDESENKRLSAAICDDTIWNPQRDPQLDKRFLEAWNLRWFNKRYRPRLEKD